MPCFVRPAEVGDVSMIVADIHPLDVEELWSGARRHPAEALSYGFAHSAPVFTAFLYGEPAAMFGVVPFENESGVSWIITTRAVDQHARTFVRHSRRYVDQMRSEYRYLFNLIDSRNTRLVNWVKWLGFQVSEPFPYGPDGVPFMRYEWGRHV